MWSGSARGPRDCAVLAIWICALGAPSARATGGEIEINQARADAGGVTPGDSSGVPVTISVQGSYRLTGPLFVGPNQVGIEVTSPNVTIDLNGFRISGITSCPSFPCTNTGTGDGIRSTQANVTVRNGTIRGMGSSGLKLDGDGCRVDNMSLIENGTNGLQGLGCRGEVTNVLALRNGTVGIHLLGGTIADNVLSGNGLDGIRLVIPSPGALITRNTTAGNFADGIRCSNCAVIANASFSNGFFGLSFDDGGVPGGSGYAHNVLLGNTAGNVFGGPPQMGGNVCDGGVPCP